MSHTEAPTPGHSKKRSLAEFAESDGQYEGQKKVAKIHPFFTKPQARRPESGTFQWLEPLGPARSCLHGVNLQPTASTKVAALDLDGTVIKSEFVKKSISGKPSFEWWRSFVPEKLKELHESGYAILLVSNQGIKPAALKTWKEKISLIGQALDTVPFRILAAIQKDQFRKPMPGMWYEIERIFREADTEIDRSSSFFVGDAAGRQYGKGKSDFSSTDRKWAQNVNLKFYTPEEYFLKLPPHENYSLPGFQASSFPDLPLITPTSSPIVPDPPTQEVVVFVGYPCLGKSSFYRQHFQSLGYEHINQDTLKTKDKCVKALEAAATAGKSCVIDNTNRNAVTRKPYLEMCKKLKIPARCFIFDGSLELAWHNDLYRTYNLPPTIAAKEPVRTLVPYGALTGFRDNYEAPQLTEGFSEIKKVNWVFQGTPEEKRYWSMWLQIDGK